MNVLLDYDAIMRDAREGDCFTSEADLSKHSVDRKTLRKIRESRAVSDNVARTLEEAINAARKKKEQKGGQRLDVVDWHAWQREGRGSHNPGAELRNARGVWRVVAQDIPLPERVYRNGPRTLEMTLTVTQEGRTLEATGIDSDQDPVEAWDAEFCDDGWVYIAGRHCIRNDSVLLTGVFYLEYERRGERMTGYYLHNETDHGSRIVLGKLTLTLLARHHPPA